MFTMTTFWIYLVLSLSFLSFNLVVAKVVEGDFVLSGVTTEHVLTSFAIRPQGGRVEVWLTLPDGAVYPNDQHLKFRLYRDIEWPRVQKAYTCREKVQHAQMILSVHFDPDDDEVDNPDYVAHEKVLMFNDKDGSSQRLHYWYFVIDDCTLEEVFQDSAIPKIHYEIKVWNHLSNDKDNDNDSTTNLTHLSADEWHLSTLHTITLVCSALVATLLWTNAVLKLVGGGKGGGSSPSNKSSASGGGVVHAAVLWMSIAASLDAASSLCELLHLQIYKVNGIGSYFLDALAAHAEAICDALLVLLLLSIASGWTLPSDVVNIADNNLMQQGGLQRLVSDLSRPLTSVSGKGGISRGAILALLILASHVILAQWGRTYNDDFESYHDFAHLPGKILMALRITLGLLFLAACSRTRNKCSARNLQRFYWELSILGFFWFQSLPFLTWLCNSLVPYYLRNPAVFIGSALLQTGSILLLSWLVTSHTKSSSYHQFSHMASPNEQSISDSVISTQRRESTGDKSVWNFGKVKVRLD